MGNKQKNVNAIKNLTREQKDRASEFGIPKKLYLKTLNQQKALEQQKHQARRR